MTTERQPALVVGRSDGRCALRRCAGDVEEGRPWVVVKPQPADAGESSFLRAATGPLAEFDNVRGGRWVGSRRTTATRPTAAASFGRPRLRSSSADRSPCRSTVRPVRSWRWTPSIRLSSAPGRTPMRNGTGVSGRPTASVGSSPATTDSSSGSPTSWGDGLVHAWIHDVVVAVRAQRRGLRTALGCLRRRCASCRVRDARRRRRRRPGTVLHRGLWLHSNEARPPPRSHDVIASSRRPIRWCDSTAGPVRRARTRRGEPPGCRLRTRLRRVLAVAAASVRAARLGSNTRPRRSETT